MPGISDDLVVADFRFALLRRSLLPLLLLASTVCPAAISFVQENYSVPQTAQSTAPVTVTYPAAQVAGDTNIVAIGWTDSTSTITSVTDTKGNLYSPVIGPTRQSGIQSQSIYVAKNVLAAAAGANTVTVVFSAAVPWPDVRALSYRGLDTVSPVETAIAATGTGTSANSGTLTTTNANDLLFAATYVTSSTKTAGTGYTSRVITPDGDIAMDQVVTAAGGYSASTTMSQGSWVLQLVALKAAGALAATATPTFTPAPGTYTGTQTVHLQDTTALATIYYTLNGTMPTTSSTVYNDTTPIQVTANTTIMAMAAASGLANSAVATGVYTIATATPTFTLAPGTYTSAQTVHLQDTTTGATIYYTLNGTTPTTSSTVYNDTTPIQVTATTTIMAMAAASGLANSAVATGAYTIGTSSGPITFVQQNYAVPQTAQSTAPVTVTYPAAQVAGDTNIVAIGWTDSTSTITSVTDTKGNIYSPAIGPTRQSGVQSQSIYVAKNVLAAAAGANTVTVVFSGAVPYPDVRILAYRGLDTGSPVEAAVGAIGTGTAANSGTLTTTNANDLLFAATYVTSSTKTAGTGYTSRVITPDGDIAMDHVVTAAGSYSATTTMSQGSWILQLVALKAAGALAATATPTFTPAPGTFTTAQTVHLQDTTTGAKIYYTLDGTTMPTTSSAVYNDTTPIQVTANTTIMAMAAASGLANSAVAPGTYTIQQQGTTATPTFTPAPGTYTGTQTVHLQDATALATIYYTLNGTTPTTSSTVYNDTTPIQVTANTTIMAMAAASGLANSAVSSGTYTFGTPAPIAYVQSNFAVPQTPQSSVSVTYTGAQTAGNLNVVVVGWSDLTSLVGSVTDTKGNTYHLAAGPTALAAGESLAIYYAANIAAAGAGGNAVTVTFNASARYPDIRIAEYSGIDPANPVDTSAAGQGTGTAANSGAVATTSANDLLVGASQVKGSTTSAGSGYTKRLITSNGDILEDQIVSALGSYSATATISSGGWIMDMVAFRGTGGTGGGGGGGGGSGAPNVSVTSPAAGSTVGGSINISASATDNTAVSGVQFRIDGVNVGPVVTASPYVISLDTTQFANGTHLISAYAWDPSRNIGSSSPVSVTFSNTSPGNPAQVGLWSGTIAWPLVSVHTTVLSTGSVLLWDAMAVGLKDPVLWDPVTSAFTTVPTNDGANIFCSGHVQMADGRIIDVGGHVAADVGLPVAHIFNPSTSTWASLPNMAFARWYPGATTLPDGRILATAGEINCRSCNAVMPEIYDPKTNQWTTLSLASMDTLYYPHMFVLPDGDVLAAGSSEGPVPARVLNIPTQTWTTIDSRLLEGGSSAMYLPGKIIKNGTSRLPDLTTPQASSALTYVLDMTQASPAWTQVGSMANPRAYHNLTLLPDGNVLATGGGITSDPIGLAGAVLPAELWSPTTQTWTTLSSMHSGRLYHSTAVLLPDARVLISGGGRFFGYVDPTDQPSAEIFSPPYLFKGPRPTITSAPSTLQYGQLFTVQTPDSARIAKVSLLRLGAATHAFNQNQRFLPLTFTQNTGSLGVTAPANANLAPPGDYLLFLVDTNGVPSVASMVRF